MGRRWLILAVLFAARTAVGFQYQSVASTSPFLMADLGIDYGQFGVLLGLYLTPGIVRALPVVLRQVLSGRAAGRVGDAHGSVSGR